MKKVIVILGLILVSCSKDSGGDSPNPEPPEEKLKFTLTVSAGEGGAVDTAGGTYNEGTTVTVTATPDSEYLFDKWSGTESSTNNPLNIVLTSNENVQANFVKKQYELAITVNGEGTVEEVVTQQGKEYASGTEVELTAVAAEGWQFSGWSGDAESTENPILITVDEAKDVTATFVRKSYELTVNITGEGTVTEEVITAPSQYEFESELRLTAEPSENWQFIGWSGDLESIDNPVTLTIDKAYNINANFELLDTDGDGVTDDVDQCPNSLFGEIVNINGCGADWEKIFGGNGGGPNQERGEYGYAVIEASDRGYAAVGYTWSYGNGNADVYLLKTDVNGDLLWQKTFGGANSDRGFSIAQTADNGFIITGRKTGYNSDWDVYLIKTDSNGNLLWEKTFGDSNFSNEGNSIIEDSDGNFVITGETTPNDGSFTTDVLLIKTDPVGNLLWEKTFSWDNQDYARSVIEDSNGNYVIVGYTNITSEAGRPDAYLIKTDKNGNLIWERTYGGLEYDDGQSVVESSDGGYIVAGGTSSFGQYNDDYIFKTDINGNLIWEKTWGDYRGQHAYSIKAMPEGGFVIGGTTGTSSDGSDFYLRKITESGEFEWVKTYGNSGNEGCRSIAITEDQGIIMIGSTFSFSVTSKLYLIKTR